MDAVSRNEFEAVVGAVVIEGPPKIDPKDVSCDEDIKELFGGDSGFRAGLDGGAVNSIGSTSNIPEFRKFCGLSRAVITLSSSLFSLLSPRDLRGVPFPRAFCDPTAFSSLEEW